MGGCGARLDQSGARECLMIYLRSILFNGTFYLWGVFMNVLWLPSLLLPAGATELGQTYWARGINVLLRLFAGIRVEVRGQENLPQGPVLMAAKHQSAWDTMIFHVITHHPAIVMKKELLAIPIYGWYCRKTKMVPVDRDQGMKSLRDMVAAAKSAARDGRHVIIFPQGTRIAPGASAPYLPGVAALYGQLGLPCVPIALNSGLFWKHRSFLKTPGTIVLEYLPAIPPGLKRKEFMAALEERIETASDRLAAEARGNGSMTASSLS